MDVSFRRLNNVFHVSWDVDFEIYDNKIGFPKT